MDERKLMKMRSHSEGGMAFIPLRQRELSADDSSHAGTSFGVVRITH